MSQVCRYFKNTGMPKYLPVNSQHFPRKKKWELEKKATVLEAGKGMWAENAAAVNLSPFFFF